MNAQIKELMQDYEALEKVNENLKGTTTSDKRKPTTTAAARTDAEQENNKNGMGGITMIIISPERDLILDAKEIALEQNTINADEWEIMCGTVEKAKQVFEDIIRQLNEGKKIIYVLGDSE